MIEVLKQALEALEELNETQSYWWQEVDEATLAKINSTITAIKEAIREHAMYEVQRLGQEIEQEPVAYKWSDAGDLKLLKKGDVLRVLRKGQEYYRAFKFCGAIEECDYAYDGNAPFAWLLVGMAYTDKIVYTRKNFSTGAVYADRGDVVEIRQPINYPTHPQRTEQEPVGRFTGKFTVDAHDRMLCEVVCSNAIPTAGAALYDAPPPFRPQNFCPRCGKRTNDIHTCTPPQENT